MSIFQICWQCFEKFGQKYRIFLKEFIKKEKENKRIYIVKQKEFRENLNLPEILSIIWKICSKV